MGGVGGGRWTVMRGFRGEPVWRWRGGDSPPAAFARQSESGVALTLATAVHRTVRRTGRCFVWDGGGGRWTVDGDEGFPRGTGLALAGRGLAAGRLRPAVRKRCRA